MSDHIAESFDTLYKVVRRQGRHIQQLEDSVIELTRRLEALERRVYELPEGVSLSRPTLKLAEAPEGTAAGGK